MLSPPFPQISFTDPISLFSPYITTTNSKYFLHPPHQIPSSYTLNLISPYTCTAKQSKSPNKHTPHIPTQPSISERREIPPLIHIHLIFLHVQKTTSQGIHIHCPGNVQPIPQLPVPPCSRTDGPRLEKGESGFRRGCICRF